ncbi:restriction endonuclease subunit S [Klebsiella variicola]|uniref:restriction endonuclease subunit S n=1 Tax=Klebsiella variicola TaxID=244366 RepID=UPI00101D381A|nr:restriction endonuclease subunit S [Klebsiella variicola]
MNWPMVKLGDVCTINPRLPKNTNPEQEVTFLAMAAVSEKGEILSQETRILHETKKGFTYFERGDVLLAKITPCFENGKATLTNSLNTQIGFGSTEFHVLRAIPELILPEYVFYLIWNEKFRIAATKEMTGSAGQKRVSADYLKEYQFYLPSIFEQEKIVSALNKGYSIHRKRQQAIKLADYFLRATFLEMFGDPVANKKKWPLRRLNDICKNVIDCPHSTPKWVDNGTICIRTSNLSKGGWVWSDKRFVSEETYVERTKRSVVDEGDIILSREGTVGVAAIVPKNLKLCMGQRLVQLKLDRNQVVPEYLLSFLLYELDPVRISRVMSGSTSKHINVSELKQLNVMLPSMKEQKLFAEIRNKIINISTKSNADHFLFEALSSQLVS